jgi:hypothetical protein
MKLECFLTGENLDIRPASNRRGWMDATVNRFAYRCLPLSIANAHGWVVGCEASFEAEWNGGDKPEDVKVFPKGDGPITGTGHFGSGILSFQLNAVFRTDPGYNLWITGPPNSFKDGIQPLSAVVETDWMPYTFSMNWKIIRPNHRISWTKGEPYCFLFPTPRGLVEEVEPVLKQIGDDPALERQRGYALNMRALIGNAKALRQKLGESEELENERLLRFQKWYMAGRMPDDSSGFEAHQKSIRPRPFLWA